MSFLPLPPASHLLEINIAFICRKVAIDKAVNSWEKPGGALRASLLGFLCGGKRSLPYARSLLCTHCLLGIVSTMSSPSAPHEVPACPRLPGGVRCGFTAIPQPAMVNSPKPALALGRAAFEAKPRWKPGISEVSKLCQRSPRRGSLGDPAAICPPAPGGTPCLAVHPHLPATAPQHLHLFQRHSRCLSFSSVR